jgi:PAS domain S-box-containing protein
MTINPTLKDFIVLFGQLYSEKDEATITRDNQFADSFRNGPIPLHWLSNTGHIIWANDAELEILGYRREEYLGRHILEVLSPSLLPPHLVHSSAQRRVTS